jgi:hypothetical protein
VSLWWLCALCFEKGPLSSLRCSQQLPCATAFLAAEMTHLLTRLLKLTPSPLLSPFACLSQAIIHFPTSHPTASLLSAPSSFRTPPQSLLHSNQPQAHSRSPFAIMSVSGHTALTAPFDGRSAGPAAPAPSAAQPFTSALTASTQSSSASVPTTATAPAAVAAAVPVVALAAAAAVPAPMMAGPAPIPLSGSQSSTASLQSSPSSSSQSASSQSQSSQSQSQSPPQPAMTQSAPAPVSAFELVWAARAGRPYWPALVSTRHVRHPPLPLLRGLI